MFGECSIKDQVSVTVKEEFQDYGQVVNCSDSVTERCCVEIKQEELESVGISHEDSLNNSVTSANFQFSIEASNVTNKEYCLNSEQELNCSNSLTEHLCIKKEPQDVENVAVSYEAFVDESLAIKEEYSCQHCQQEFPSEELLTSHSCIVANKGCGESSEKGNDSADSVFVSDVPMEQFAKQTETQVQPKRKREASKKIDESKPTLQENKKNYDCKACNRAFTSRQTLRSHMRSHAGERSYVCKTCGKGFVHPSSLTNHSRTHTGEKPFTCSICKTSFSRVGTRNKHMRTHTNEKPFKCQVCDKAFVRTTTLNDHMRMHNGDDSFKCDICSKTFGRNALLKQHYVVHTKEKPFQCEICFKSFGLNGTLKRHLVVHTGERPYICRTCGKTFTDPGSINAHLRAYPNKSCGPVVPKCCKK